MPRFLTLADVAEILNISMTQAYSLVKSGDLPALKIGGEGKGGQWRVEADRLEEYIARMYERTRAEISGRASEPTEQQDG
ncbi:MAG: helix-turn-helix domain-containing protein [Actinomycetales bacterium]|jgi:excisionase family DNA binding protein|nr:helix-turn-helix domain-containing protein [Actinomycetales bacterium]